MRTPRLLLPLAIASLAGQAEPGLAQALGLAAPSLGVGADRGRTGAQEPSAGAAGKVPSLPTAPVGAQGLMAGPEDFAALRQALGKDPLLARWHRELEAEARTWLRQAPVPPRGDGFWSVQGGSRRLLLLAGLHRMQPNPAFAARAKRELLAMAAWPSWWPQVGLLLGETTEAVAIGLDWLRPELSPSEAAQVEAALVTKGLEVMEGDYHSARPA